MPYRVVQPWGRIVAGGDRISSWPTITDAFTEIDRYSARVKTSKLPGDQLELLVVDGDGREVRRPETN